MASRRAFWSYLEEFPPLTVRIMGRQGRGRGCRALTIQEIADGSGLTIERIREIESQTDWKGIDLPEAEAFCRGCRFDPSSLSDRRTKVYLYLQQCQDEGREPGFYLRNSPQWPQFQKMLKRLQSSQELQKK